MPLVEFICLANSRKHEGRCVAGLRLDGEGWVRPVSPLDGTLWPVHYTLDDGSEARLLDVIRADLGPAQTGTHQPENRLIGEVPWSLVVRPVGPEAIPILRDRLLHGELLFGTRGRCVPYGCATVPVPRSLGLVYPRALLFSAALGARGNRQLRAGFEIPGLPGVRYDLPVTDPAWEARLAALRPGESCGLEAAGLSPRERLLLTVSLGEPFEDHLYKLVAAVIVLPHWPPPAAHPGRR